MMQFKNGISKSKSALVITHVVYRKSKPFDTLEGPYSSVCNALTKNGYDVDTLQIPLERYDNQIVAGKWKSEDIRLNLPSFLGMIATLKYLTDLILIFVYSLLYFLRRKNQNKVVIAIDPLSCLSLVLLKKITYFKLIFYSVDFNKSRFKNPFLQFLYEKADKVSTIYSDECWVVCQSLAIYKKKHFRKNCIYIPNSVQFDESIYNHGVRFKTGNKLGWTGSFITDKQFDIFFLLLKKIQDLQLKMEFYVAPTGKHEQFLIYAKQYKIKSLSVLHLTSRKEWQEYAAKLDVGLAIYDPDFGSTEFIEPLKIWDYMLCGMPFIISGEPSLSDAIKKTGVAYILGPKNTIQDKNKLKEFLDADNLAVLHKKCVALAKEFDIGRQIKIALKNR